MKSQAIDEFAFCGRAAKACSESKFGSVLSRGKECHLAGQVDPNKLPSLPTVSGGSSSADYC